MNRHICDQCERVYRGYGRICGMALAMGELANFTFAPYFLRQVLLPDSNPSLEERLEELRLDDPVLVGSMQSLLATAAAQMAGEPTAEGKPPQYRCRLGCILSIWVAFFSRQQRYCC